MYGALVGFEADLNPTGSMDAGYEALTARQKLDTLWPSIQGSAYPAGTALPKKEPGAAEQVGLVWPPHLKPTFMHSSDIMPARRSKLIHTFGSVAKVSLQIKSTSRQALCTFLENIYRWIARCMQLKRLCLFDQVRGAARNDRNATVLMRLLG